MSDFEADYFMQTRREIDTEKIERNKLLHLAILVLGDAYAVLLNGALSKSDVLFQIPILTLVVAVISLVIPLRIFVTAITKARLIRKFQIADRWLALHDMLSRRNDLTLLHADSSFEKKVVAGLRGTRYVAEDKAVFTALSLFVCFPLVTLFLCFGLHTHNHIPLAIALLLCLLHFSLSWRWLFHRSLLPNDDDEDVSNTYKASSCQ